MLYVPLEISEIAHRVSLTRVNYYGKTYYVKVDDIGDDYDDDVVGFYSVNLDGLPFIVTGLDIRDHPRVSFNLMLLTS